MSTFKRNGFTSQGKYANHKRRQLSLSRSFLFHDALSAIKILTIPGFLKCRGGSGSRSWSFRKSSNPNKDYVSPWIYYPVGYIIRVRGVDFEIVSPPLPSTAFKFSHPSHQRFKNSNRIPTSGRAKFGDHTSSFSPNVAPISKPSAGKRRRSPAQNVLKRRSPSKAKKFSPSSGMLPMERPMRPKHDSTFFVPPKVKKDTATYFWTSGHSTNVHSADLLT